MKLGLCFLLVQVIVLLSVALAKKDKNSYESQSGNESSDNDNRNRVRCLELNDSCERVRNGVYGLCTGCNSGQYIVCANGRKQVRSCPKLPPLGTQLVYDAYRRSCRRTCQDVTTTTTTTTTTSYQETPGTI
ncbi:uncharacterized protein LOC106055144 isoform X1 [Biomphalaria glabrata]|uniref:Uncharacterized protein LOC106055144 isoform X1 n=1 Tax=Biomphalaria glabrata TaxID=6526 RepID=A0A9W2YY17_BIOGL|nr:uncharacterized protein LOC106055144 isoform X1 [Biomphalaria glabrata]